MERRPFGPLPQTVPVIGQGTWYQRGDRREPSIAALRRGLDLGMTHIDVAEMYLNGTAEEWVAEAIEGRRDEVFLVSKVLPRNASRRGTVEACERSLARLRTGHLDCYLLHWRTDDHPLEDTVEAFRQLRREGKILSWGVSNFDVGDLDELGESPACDQVLYHLKERAVEHAVLPWCEKAGAALVAYSPFGHDDFPDKPVLRQIADELSATPRQVALRFLLRHPNSFVIPKASSPEHAAENARAGDLKLSQDQIARLDKAFPPGRRPCSLPTL